jgi:hypothetical protein
MWGSHTQYYFRRTNQKKTFLVWGSHTQYYFRRTNQKKRPFSCGVPTLNTIFVEQIKKKTFLVWGSHTQYYFRRTNQKKDLSRVGVSPTVFVCSVLCVCVAS